MSFASTTWQIRHLADLGWDVAQAADPLLAERGPVPDEHLVEFWIATRSLANRWLAALSEWPSAARTSDSKTLFESVAAEILVGDMLLRLWSTVLVVQDRQSGQNDARPVLDLVMFNLQHVRHRLLAALLVDAAEFAELDRLRRRCERWTDVLLGPMVVKFGQAQYAHDARRAWDFGEDADVSRGSDVAARMLQSSFRTAFQGSELRQPVSSEPWSSIISHIDTTAAGRLGPLWPAAWKGPPQLQPEAFQSSAFDAGEDGETALVRSLRRLHQQHRHS